MTRTVRLLLAGLLLTGCAAKVDPRSPFDEDDPRALREDRERAQVAAAHGALPPADAHAEVTGELPPIAIPGIGARAGEVTRAELAPVLAAGPGSFLRWFEVEAASHDGRFLGWRLLKILPAGRPLTALDLMPGDVLVAVNGRPLIRPGDLSELWATLATADAIVAELLRGGVRFELRFAITDAPIARP